MSLSPVGPAPGAPFDTIDCPDDFSQAKAEDIRRSTAALLGNDELVLDHAAFDSVVRPGGNPGTWTFDQVNTSYLKGGLVECGALSQFQKGAAGTYTRVSHHIPKVDATQWTLSTPSNGQVYIEQQDIDTPVADDNWAEYPLHVADGATVTELRVFWIAQTGHSVLPTNLPRIELVRQDLTTTVGYTISDGGTHTVGYGSVAAYEAPHEIVFTVSPGVVIDASDLWAIRFRGERGAGGNALSGGKAYPPRVKSTRVKVGEE